MLIKRTKINTGPCVITNLCLQTGRNVWNSNAARWGYPLHAPQTYVAFCFPIRPRSSNDDAMMRLLLLRYSSQLGQHVVLRAWERGCSKDAATGSWRWAGGTGPMCKTCVRKGGTVSISTLCSTGLFTVVNAIRLTCQHLDYTCTDLQTHSIH